MIRPAEKRDIPRIAEILIFTKRMTYRPIFQDDAVSFGEMQVVSLAEEYERHPERLEYMWVYEEMFVKALITLRTDSGQRGKERILLIQELYVDVFFHREGIGGKLLAFAENMAKQQEAKGLSLWVLEKNDRARAFYRRHGFDASGERREEPGTAEYLLKYRKTLGNHAIARNKKV